MFAYQGVRNVLRTYQMNDLLRILDFKDLKSSFILTP